MRVFVSILVVLGVAVEAAERGARPLSAFIRDRSERPVAAGRFAPSLLSKFADFCEQHHRLYRNAADLLRHMAVFEQFDQLAAEHQRREHGTARHGPTIFADLTHEEFVRTRTGARLPPADCFTNGTAPASRIRSPANRAKRDLPVCIDYRNQGVVGSVKDQGACGNCYAFASLGALESVYAMEYGLSNEEVPDFSEAEVSDCLYDAADDSFGCNGGYANAVYEYIQDQPGVTTEQAYPFLDTADHTQCTLQTSDPKEVVSPREITEIYSPADITEDEMLEKLHELGPFYVAIDANFLDTYQDGILDPEEPENGWDVNHAIVVVGHCVDADTDTPYWIGKNSWGEDWGEQGYFKLVAGKNALDITINPVWVSFK